VAEGARTAADRRVRRAGVADAPEVARLLHDFNTEFGDPTPGPGALTDRLRELLEGEAITVLLVGERPDGFALLRFRPSLWNASLDAYLEELYVAPERRGEGMGRAVLEEAIDLARQAGARHIDLATSVDDSAARSLYESCGFTNNERPPDGPAMLFYERDL
jgi:ribosomal protein S18 acetylase RimI-like enzyme